MTDQQHRGAYTPPGDVPLEFDPRGPAARRPLPLALIASAALLLLLLAAVVLYYRRGVRGENEPPRPVGEPVAALKTAPAPAAQPPAAEGEEPAPTAAADRPPSFAPDPEAPKPRPAPGALRVEAVPAGEMPRPPAVVVRSPAPAPIKGTAAASATPPAAPAAPPAAPAAPPAAPAAAVLRPAHSVPAPTSATTAGGVRVQIGAFSSAALAETGWREVAALEPVAVRGRGKKVEAVEKDGHTLYRTSVTGFADKDEAGAFCDALKAKGRICFVKY